MKVCYTGIEYAVINRLASRYGVPMAVFVRNKSLDHVMKPRITPEEQDLFRKIAGMHNNLNQLTRLANMGKVLILHIIKIMDELEIILKKLR